MVVAMGHTSECHAVVTGGGGLPWHMLGGGRQDDAACVLISPETDSCCIMPVVRNQSGAFNVSAT